MKRVFESRLIWGILLILAGVIFLFENLFSFSLGSVFWALAFAVAGAFFLSLYIQNRANWWAFIPSFALLGIAATITLSEVLPFNLDWLSGPAFLGMLGLGFLMIFLLHREHWWSLIPGGVLLTLAMVAAVSEFSADGNLGGGVLFLGMGLTFALLALLPTRGGPQRWAWIPAGILLAMGLLLMASLGEWINWVWPLVLIAGGGLLLLRSLRTREQ